MKIGRRRDLVRGCLVKFMHQALGVAEDQGKRAQQNVSTQQRGGLHSTHARWWVKLHVPVDSNARLVAGPGARCDAIWDTAQCIQVRRAQTQREMLVLFVANSTCSVQVALESQCLVSFLLS